MLLAEYDYDTDIAVQRAEEREIAFAEGIEQGFCQGRNEGFSDGVRQTKLDTAKLLKQFGDSIQKIVQATGLSEEEIEKL